MDTQRHYPPRDPKQTARLIALYNAGYAIAALKERFGISPSVLYRLLEQEGVAVRRGPTSLA
jgi:hypothetical protein